MTAFFVSIHFIGCPFRAGPIEEMEFAVSQLSGKFALSLLPVLASNSREGTQTFLLQIVRDKQVLEGAISERFNLPEVHPGSSYCPKGEREIPKTRSKVKFQKWGNIAFTLCDTLTHHWKRWENLVLRNHWKRHKWQERIPSQLKKPRLPHAFLLISASFNFTSSLSKWM